MPGACLPASGAEARAGPENGNVVAAVAPATAANAWRRVSSVIRSLPEFFCTAMRVSLTAITPFTRDLFRTGRRPLHEPPVWANAELLAKLTRFDAPAPSR